MLTAQAVQRTAPTVPIVVALFDPLASGLVTNLAHPGGQVTGLTSMSADLYGKRLQLLKEALPSLKRVAVLWSPRMSWFTSKSVPTYIKMQDHLKALAS